MLWRGSGNEVNAMAVTSTCISWRERDAAQTAEIVARHTVHPERCLKESNQNA